MAYSERKFTELVLYVADRLRGDRAGGAAKLNKVVFFAEFTHLRRCRGSRKMSVDDHRKCRSSERPGGLG